MVDHYQFHLARAEAERVAAGKAASALTRALHLQLAGLHLDHAVSLEADEPAAVIYAPPRRRHAATAAASPV